jgi:hypothetical protein
MNAVVRKQNEDMPPVVTEGPTLLAVISRAAADPQTDVEKMERLMAMYERIESKRAETAFSDALAQMQDELPSIGERGSAAGRYTYALWEGINAAIKPVLKRHGFALSFRTDFADGIAVTGVLSHSGGHKIETTIKLPPDTSGNKPAVQAVASSVSYGKRYAAGALLNLTSHGEDDDAFAASDTHDASDWYAAIDCASSMDELNRLAGELKTAGIPSATLKNVRSAWAKRAKELKS